MKSVLFFFTAEYPIGSHENFIENEIHYTTKEFDEILLFPYQNMDKKSRKIPSNAKIIIRNESLKKLILIRNALLVIKILFLEWYHCKSKWFFIRNLKLWISYIKKGLITAEFIGNQISIHKHDNKQFYSYWMNDWALCLAILKHKKIINGFSFRCGGFDIWNERHKGLYLPFRYFIYSKADKIFPNSKLGETYLKNLNFFSHKINLSYWGTRDKGVGPINFNNDLLVIVSCSSLIPLKRVALIANALMLVHRSVKWVHFGDGILRKELNQLIEKLPSNIEFCFMGNVPNDEIHNFYRENAVDFFITTSETESLPVSIQEAISYGIPVVATNVGGINEIVRTNDIGFLLDPIPTVESICKLIQDFNTVHWRSHETRKKIRNFWIRNFNADRVYPNFYNNLKSH